MQVSNFSRLSWWICSVCAGIWCLTTFLIYEFWLCKYSGSPGFSHTCVLAVYVSVVSRLSLYLCSGFTNTWSLKTFLIHLFWMCMYPEFMTFLKLVFWICTYPKTQVNSDTCVQAVELSVVSHLYWYLCSCYARILCLNFLYLCSGCAIIRCLTAFLKLVFWLCKYPVSHDFSDTCVLAVQISAFSLLFWYSFSGCTFIRCHTTFLILCSGSTIFRILTTILILVFWDYKYLESRDISDSCVLALQLSAVSRLFWYLHTGCAIIRWLTTFLILCFDCASIWNLTYFLILVLIVKNRSFATFPILVFWLCSYPGFHDFSYTCVLATHVYEVSRFFWYFCSGCEISVVSRDF